jgi:hypothetical protein
MYLSVSVAMDTINLDEPPTTPQSPPLSRALSS